MDRREITFNNSSPCGNPACNGGCINPDDCLLTHPAREIKGSKRKPDPNEPANDR